MGSPLKDIKVFVFAVRMLTLWASVPLKASKSAKLFTMVWVATKNARPNSLLVTATCLLLKSEKLTWPAVSVAVGAKVSILMKGDVPAFPKLLEASV